jgi:hypothetical protein
MYLVYSVDQYINYLMKLKNKFLFIFETGRSMVEEILGLLIEK